MRPQPVLALPSSTTARAGITFGGMRGGDFKKILKYSKDKVFAFAMVLGPLNDRIWTTGAGAISMGFPAIANTDIPTIHPTGVTIYEEVAKELDPKNLVQKCIEVRGLKITVSKPPIPVAYGPAFEGERIRKEDMHIEFGGQRTPAFEWLHTVDLIAVEDGKVNHHRHRCRGALPERRPRCPSACTSRLRAARCRRTSNPCWYARI